ncbi:LysR family transcriptional regulator [Mesorhizobium sp. B2-3-4]|uniref:LysR family transcriptional regulator n=1 Tax=Mesorhizobium sp. B2-3-4 TaxID=2589959 RepID=UPI00112BDDA9|nr:LysR family transcriptional regulator [Mesorhizobium sp. B2-3-4]TPM40770.1 LysR family transcriptional regulator [Mesorhizobium sp. B2-3-4]
MKTLKTSLPLLNAMVVFEAAARHGGLTPAAQELNIAQSAVSRHVANLERQLSVELFSRRGNRVAITGAGIALAGAIRDGLTTIRQAVEELTEHDSDTFVVGCSHDLAQAWLMPRFGLITSLVADGRVLLQTSSDYRDFDQPEVALSIRFGEAEQWPDLVAEKLFDGEWFPVCAPAFLARYPALASEEPEAFLGVPLLHQATPPRAIDSWQSWIGTNRKLEGPRFTSYMSMIHETIAGRGAALAWAGFADEQLRLGQLVRLTRASRRHAGSFHIVMRKNAGPTVKAVARALLGSVGAN